MSKYYRSLISQASIFLNEYSMNLDGFNERLNTGDDVLDILGAFSLTVRIKPDSAGSLQCVLCKDTTSGTNRSWNLYYRGSGSGLRKLYFSLWNSDGTLNTLSSSVAGYFEDGNWHTVLITYSGLADANGLKMYIDGSLDSQMTAGSTGVRNYTGVNSKISIGSTSGGTGGWYYGGSGITAIDEVAAWDGTELNASDASDIHNGGPAIDISYLSPSHWWRMGDGSSWDGTNHTVPDVSGSADITSEFMEETDKITDVAT